ARRGSVNLAFCEHTHIAAVMFPPPRGPGENRSIEKAQIRLEWMLYGHGTHDRMLDLATGLDEGQIMGAIETETERLGLDDGVEGTPIRKVEFHCAQAVNR